MARYYEIKFDKENRLLTWQENKELKEKAVRLDGAYLLRSNRKNLSSRDIWRIYMLLNMVEQAFRDLKGPLALRPIFHQLSRRVETHIFICILAYHLLFVIEKRLQEGGIHRAWETVRKELSTHQIATVSMKTQIGSTLLIRQATNPNAVQQEIYAALKIPTEIIKPVHVLYTTS